MKRAFFVVGIFLIVWAGMVLAGITFSGSGGGTPGPQGPAGPAGSVTNLLGNAAYVYVNNTYGSDVTGKPNTPNAYATLQAAVTNVLWPGTNVTMFIHAGTYSESVFLQSGSLVTNGAISNTNIVNMLGDGMGNTLILYTNGILGGATLLGSGGLATPSAYPANFGVTYKDFSVFSSNDVNSAGGNAGVTAIIGLSQQFRFENLYLNAINAADFGNVFSSYPGRILGVTNYIDNCIFVESLGMKQGPLFMPGTCSIVHNSKFISTGQNSGTPSPSNTLNGLSAINFGAYVGSASGMTNLVEFHNCELAALGELGTNGCAALGVNGSTTPTTVYLFGCYLHGASTNNNYHDVTNNAGFGAVTVYYDAATLFSQGATNLPSYCHLIPGSVPVVTPGNTPANTNTPAYWITVVVTNGQTAEIPAYQ